MILTAPQTGGHGSLINLEQNDKVSVYYSLSCNVGGFDLDSAGGVASEVSFIERITSLEKSGAVAMVANSRWGWVYSSYFLEAAFTEHLYNSAEGSPVEAMYYSWLDYPYYRDLIYGQNYFGDPTLKIYLSIPSQLEVDVSSIQTDHQVLVTADAEPTKSALISLAHDGHIIETGITNKNGEYELSSELMYGDEYDIVALKDGCTIAHKQYSPGFSLEVDEPVEVKLPSHFELNQNYPNPFNPTTTISYSLPRTENVSIEIYNILGQLVSSTQRYNQQPGTYSIKWDATDRNGRAQASGIYFYRLVAGDFTDTRKMIYLK
jgi:flagellar hook assembly protein FlgD